MIDALSVDELNAVYTSNRIPYFYNTDSNITILEAAVITENVELVAKLIQKGANVNITTHPFGYTIAQQLYNNIQFLSIKSRDILNMLLTMNYQYYRY